MERLASTPVGIATLHGQLRLAVLRLARRLRQQTVGNVTPSQLSALMSIAKYQGSTEDGLSLGELAAIEQVAPPSMTRIAARLEESGLVHRTTSPTDRRVAQLTMSEDGRRLIEETRTRRDAYLALRLAQLSEEEREVLAQAVPLLERLASDEPD